MELFREHIQQPHNLLPDDGVARYHGVLISLALANEYYDSLMKTIPWENDHVVMYGKRIVTKRKVAWYGDQPFDYCYSNVTRRASLWTAELLALKNLVEDCLGESFNSCLLNLYHDGSEGMSWHSDNEKELKKNGVIASFSLGAERVFHFRHKSTREKVSVMLEHGGLLVMEGETQQLWQHCLPVSRRVVTPRINLTFRNIIA